MEPLSEDHAGEVRDIARQEVERAFQALEDELRRLGGRKGAVSADEIRVAVSDAFFQYKRLSS